MKKYRNNYIILLFILFTKMGISAELRPSDQVPLFSLIKLEHQKYFKSGDFIGKKNLVISFFSYWSFSFNKYLTQLVSIYEKYGRETVFLLISVKEKKTLIKKYINERSIPIKVEMDKFGGNFKKFHGKSIPFLAVVNKEGIVTYTNDNFQDGFENDPIKRLKLN